MYVSIKIFYKIFLWYIFMKNKHSYLLDLFRNKYNYIVRVNFIRFNTFISFNKWKKQIYLIVIINFDLDCRNLLAIVNTIIVNSSLFTKATI